MKARTLMVVAIILVLFLILLVEPDGMLTAEENALPHSGAHRYGSPATRFALDSPSLSWEQNIPHPNLLAVTGRSAGYGWPVSDPWVTQDFSGAHPALDIVPATGDRRRTPIYAVNDGSVRFVGEMTGNSGPGCQNDPRTAAGGLTVVLDHLGDDHSTRYNHLDAFAPGLSKGQKVKRGQLIGYMGDTGCAPFGPHLHFVLGDPGSEYQVLNPVDPMNYLPPLAVVAPRNAPPHLIRINPCSPALNTRPNLEFTLRNMTDNLIDISRLFVRTYGPNGAIVEADANTGPVAPGTTANFTANQGDMFATAGLWQLGKIEIRVDTNTWLRGIPLDSLFHVGEPNLAKGRPVSVSSTEPSDNTASNAVDGDLYTRWASNWQANPPDTQPWIEVDLGSNQIVDTLLLRWENAYPGEYVVEVREENGGWHDVYEGAGITTIRGRSGDQEVRFVERRARYVRLRALTLRPGFGNISLWELEIYNRGGPSGSFAVLIGITDEPS